MKYDTSYILILSPFSASDLHSIVQPRVNAAGNHATTTGFLPLKSDSWYVLPSVACSLKFGAWSPTLRSAVCAIAALARPRTRVAVNSARIAQPPGLLEASEYTRVFTVVRRVREVQRVRGVRGVRGECR